LLAHQTGCIPLPDGSSFNPVYKGIGLLIAEAKLRKDLGREPVMADFDEADQAQLGYYARWHPGSCEHGQLAVLLAEMGNRLSFFTES
jgi:hypothetical protein